MDMIKRPRRLRRRRDNQKDGAGDPDGQVFSDLSDVCTGRHRKRDEIPSMPGQFRYTLDRLPYELECLAKAGVGSVMLFGIPDHKDEMGSQCV